LFSLKADTILLWQSGERVEIIGANLLTHSIFILELTSLEVLNISNPEKLTETVTLTSAEDENATLKKSMRT
jgi:hypothetical protein